MVWNGNAKVVPVLCYWRVNENVEERMVQTTCVYRSFKFNSTSFSNLYTRFCWISLQPLLKAHKWAWEQSHKRSQGFAATKHTLLVPVHNVQPAVKVTVSSHHLRWFLHKKKTGNVDQLRQQNQILIKYILHLHTSTLVTKLK